MLKIIRLEKVSEAGNNVYWQASVSGRGVTYEWGVIGGVAQRDTVTYDKGKNEGRSNETTPEQQCLFEVERKARKKIEGGYALVTGELETVSETVKKSNLEVPKPMLAKTFDDQFKRVKEWRYILLQRKLDGNRVLVNTKTGKLYSRQRKEITSIPGLGEEVARAFEGTAVEWADGELFSPLLTFNEIQSIIRKSNSVDSRSASITFHCFDVVSDASFDSRRFILDALPISNRVKVVQTETLKSYSVADIEEKNKQYVSEGYEGVILRNPDAPYEQKRSGSLIKYKTFYDDEYKVIGWVSEKNNSGLLGAAVCETATGDVFNARPAMSEVEKALIWDHKEKYVGQLATIKFQERDPKTHIPRFPVLKGFRSDV
jgi:DNA ligase 1